MPISCHADRTVRRDTFGQRRRPRGAVPARPSAAHLRGSRDGAVPAGPHSRARSTRAAARRPWRPRPGTRSARTTWSPRSTASSRATSRVAARPPTRSATSSARPTSPTFGRDGNMHFGAPANGVFPLVSMLGDLVPLVTGAALAFKKRGQPRVAMTFLGEGAFSVGDTHEGPQPRRRLAGAGRLRDPGEPLLVLDARRAADGEHEHRAAHLRRLVDPRRAGRRNRCPGRARDRPRRPSSGRGTAAGRRRSRR